MSARSCRPTIVDTPIASINFPYQNADGLADFQAAGRHTNIGLLTNGETLPGAKERARHTDVKMTMKNAHIGTRSGEGFGELFVPGV
jgi:hypothetical protein